MSKRSSKNTRRPGPSRSSSRLPTRSMDARCTSSRSMSQSIDLPQRLHRVGVERVRRLAQLHDDHGRRGPPRRPRRAAGPGRHGWRSGGCPPKATRRPAPGRARSTRSRRSGPRGARRRGTRRPRARCGTAAVGRPRGSPRPPARRRSADRRPGTPATATRSPSRSTSWCCRRSSGNSSSRGPSGFTAPSSDTGAEPAQAPQLHRRVEVVEPAAEGHDDQVREPERERTVAVDPHPRQRQEPARVEVALARRAR